MPDYFHPEILVDTTWVAARLDDSNIRLVESDEDYLLYETGHLPGAVKVDWFSTLQDSIRRDFIDQAAFETMCSGAGITNDTCVVFYGDRYNWFACYAFWLFEYYGHTNKRILDGGRLKWEKEGLPLTRVVPYYPHTLYKARPPDNRIRAFRDQVMAHLQAGLPLVDVRSPQEYTGELVHMVNYPQEGATRGGHIPGAVNVPWSAAVNQNDGTFKPALELDQLYTTRGITQEKPVITYCRIGERSSHTWFVLKYLLGFPQVSNYDGSWTEWGNLVNVPIARGE